MFDVEDMASTKKKLRDQALFLSALDDEKKSGKMKNCFMKFNLKSLLTSETKQLNGFVQFIAISKSQMILFFTM